MYCLLWHLPIVSIAYTVPHVAQQVSITNTILGQGRIYKTAVFTDNVTIDGSNNFTVNGTDQLEVFADIGDEVAIQAASISGITVGNFPLVTTSVGASVVIDGNVVIQGDLDLSASGASLTVNGDVTVVGGVNVSSGATVTVNGDVIFDGNSTDSVTINGTLTTNGINDNGSLIKQGDLTIKNTLGASPGVTIANAISATGLITFDNNQGASGSAGVSITTVTGLSTPVVQSDIGIVFKNNQGDSPGSGAAGAGVLIRGNSNHISVPVIRATLGNIVFENNQGGTASDASAGGSGVDIEPVTGLDLTAVQARAGDVCFINNTGGNSAGALFAGAGVHIAPTRAETSSRHMVQALGGGSIQFINNIGGSNTTNFNGAGVDLADSSPVGSTGNGLQADQNIIFNRNSSSNTLNNSGYRAVFIRNENIVATHGDVRFESHLGANAGTGGVGGDGVTLLNFTTSFDIKAGNNIMINNNQGGQSNAGNNGVDGLSATSGVNLIAGSTIILQDNVGGAANTGTGGTGIDFAGTMQAGHKVICKNNTRGATSGTNGYGFLNSGTVRADEIIFDQNVFYGLNGVGYQNTTVAVAGSGAWIGHVKLHGNLVNYAQVFDITGDFSVIGGDINMNFNQGITVTGDILLDGQDKNNIQFYMGGGCSVTGRSFTMRNYDVTNTAFQGIAFFPDGGNTTTLIIDKDIIIENLRSSLNHPVAVNATVRSLSGDIIFRNNTSSSAGNAACGVNIFLGILEAENGTLLFANNRATVATSGDGVCIDNSITSMISRNMIFNQNTSCNPNRHGVFISFERPIVQDNLVLYQNQTASGGTGRGVFFDINFIIAGFLFRDEFTGNTYQSIRNPVDANPFRYYYSAGNPQTTALPASNIFTRNVAFAAHTCP